MEIRYNCYMKCIAKDCGRDAISKSCCDKHYRRLIKHGDINYVRQHEKIKCLIDDCTNIAISKKYCEKHYRKYKKYGDANFFVDRKIYCSIKGCNKKHLAKGLCYIHYWSEKQKIVISKKDSEYIENHDGRCDICGQNRSVSNRALCIDHDHLTGIFRGMLCSKCNVGLGHFDDNPIILKSAIEYLSSKNPFG